MLWIFLWIGLLFAPLSVQSYQVMPATLKPGQEGLVQITLKNVPTTTDTNAVEDIAVYYVSVVGLEITATNPVRVGTLESGSSTIATVPFRVAASARGGIVSPTFSIRQKDTAIQLGLTVPISVSNPPIIGISVNKQTLLSTDDLNVVIDNRGGSVTKLVLRLNGSEQFSFISTDQVYVGDVQGHVIVPIRIDARKAEDGINSIPFTLTYQKEDGTEESILKEVPVTVKKEKADVLFGQRTTLVTAQTNRLQLDVHNTGRSLQNFRVVFDDDEIRPKENNEVKLGDFDMAEDKQLDIQVLVNAQPGVHNMRVTLKWVEEDVEKEEQTTIPVVVSSDADVAIYVDSKPAPLVPGNEYTISVLTSNIGSYKIENVEIELQEGELFNILNAQKTQYIGGLQNDDFSTVQYKARVKDVAPGSYPVTVRVKYKDPSGAWQEKNVTRDVLVRSASEAAGAGRPGIPWPLVGLAVLAGAGYWWFRMRNKKAPA